MPWLIAFLKRIFVFLLPHLLEWVKDKIVESMKKAKEFKERKKQEAKAYKEYHAVITDPYSTKEEKDRAAAKFLND